MVYSITNQKGGVGKTTVATHIAYALSSVGHKVLLIDCDPQCNSSNFLLPDYLAFYNQPDSQLQTLYSTIIKQQPLVPIASRYQNLDLVPSHILLSTTDLELAGAIDHRETRLKRQLVKIQDNYDYVIIDTPPALGMLTINAFIASSRLIVVIEPGEFPMQGINQLSETIDTVINGIYEHNIELRGFLLNKGQKRTLSTSRAWELLKEVFGKKLYKVYLPYRTAVMDAQELKQTVFEYQPSNEYAMAFNLFITIEFS